ncbi:MAG: DUF2188 domain-containing protein [Paludibacter sp.]
MATLESSLNKRTHVVKRSSGWAVKTEGASRASRVYVSKEAAIRGAQKYSTTGSDIVIHKGDGTIQKWEKSKLK